jgi:hypothetical protein
VTGQEECIVVSDDDKEDATGNTSMIAVGEVSVSDVTNEPPTMQQVALADHEEIKDDEADADDEEEEGTLNRSFIELTLNPYTAKKIKFQLLADTLGEQIERDLGITFDCADMHEEDDFDSDERLVEAARNAVLSETFGAIGQFVAGNHMDVVRNLRNYI